MKEIILISIYWLANILLIVWSILLAIALWEKKNRLLKSITLVGIGITWQIIRAIYTFSQNQCDAIETTDSLLNITNKCIPPMDVDVIYAQLAILTGFFVILGELALRYSRKNNNND